VPAAALVGLAVGWIGLRGGLAGVGFAIFTLLAAEAGHIAATAAGVQAVPAAALLPEFHNKPIAAYYLILAMAAAALLISRHLLRSRLGCCWLAVREDPMVAAASGIDVLRTRLSALMISAALTAPAGVFLAYAATPADLDRLFSSSLSLEIMLSAVVGGLGTLLGPVIGALVLAPLDQALTGWAASRPHPLPGLVPLCYGAILMVMVMARSRGLWPWLAPRLGLVPAFEDEDGDGGGDGDGDDGDGDRRS
jgi:branched-chain amino acid transport system permease protein